MTRTQEEARQTRASIEELQAQIQAAENNVVEIRDMAGYAEKAEAINEKIRKLNGELADMMMDTNAAVQKLRREQATVQAEINDQMAIISKESLLDYAKKRIEDLREDARIRGLPPPRRRGGNGRTGLRLLREARDG